MLNLRPKYSTALILAPQHFPADLYLIDWLEAMGHHYDVLTDEDLHAEGTELLSRIASSSPAATTSIGRARCSTPSRYLADGGRWMSLTGNGYCWPIGIDPDRPHLLEIRRGQNGTGTWRSAPARTGSRRPASRAGCGATVGGRRSASSASA